MFFLFAHSISLPLRQPRFLLYCQRKGDVAPRLGLRRERSLCFTMPSSRCFPPSNKRLFLPFFTHWPMDRIPVHTSRFHILAHGSQLQYFASFWRPTRHLLRIFFFFAFFFATYSRHSSNSMCECMCVKSTSCRIIRT